MTADSTVEIRPLPNGFWGRIGAGDSILIFITETEARENLDTEIAIRVSWDRAIAYAFGGGGTT